jgi:5-(carboxyamino)imidazole ribonucleotide mutase
MSDRKAIAISKKIEAQLSELSVEAKAKGAQLSARRNVKTGFNQ